jgi:hypothetical protein
VERREGVFVACLSVGLIPLANFLSTYPFILVVVIPRRQFRNPLPESIHNKR